MKKGVIFDVDGVIVDVSQSYHYAIKHTAEHFLGKEVDINLVRHLKFSKGINNDWVATLEVIKELGGKARLEEVVEVFNRTYRELRDQEELLLRPEFFKELRDAGYPLGVVTGRPREDLNYLFEKHGLFRFFDFVVDEDTIEQKELRKPHPYALHLCVEGLRIEAGIYVGDTLADYYMVRAYRELYPKPVEYIHVGKNFVPEGVRHCPPEELPQVLPEVLRSL
ncbi:MAG: HAD-IA family hydrolase [Aquificaceae bacterium]|nr:HAD-IA family hydrolase [Aquificaceae bacterium]MCX8059731.1 HAD-IA family hydrolase [Aquificaceae bacterium]MDW8096578.1 HAD-IA family hydrolase [Aquificaceae bacterium]